MQPKNPLISIIILNYNAGNLLIDCVRSVFASSYPNFEVIVVDNVSTDNSHRICKDNFEKIKLIENKENLGYCEGNNVGIRNANGEYIVILNPDTLVETDWLEKFLDATEKYGEGLFQGKNVAIDNEKILRSTGNMIHLFGFGSSRSKGELDTGKYTNIEEINYASGTCLFTSKKIFTELDLFDSFLFAYHDDLDLCWRASMQGIQSYYVPSSIVFHPSEGFSFKWSNFKFFLLERNRLYCLFTHYSRSTILKLLPSLVLVDIAVSFFYLKNGLFSEKIKASLDILRNFGNIQSRYNQIQEKRIVQDKDIIYNFKNEVILPKGTNIKNKIPFNSVLKVLSQLCRIII